MVEMKRFQIDTRGIIDWESFHSYLANTLSFPDYYGRNMNAWIDCMTDFEEPIVLELQDARNFHDRLPDLYNALIECCSFVNYRRLEQGETANIILSFHH